MLRALSLKKTLRLAGDDMPRRRKRRFAPTLGESASKLEDRSLLSTISLAPQNLVNTPVGQHVTQMFQSILNVTPTTATVNHQVRLVRAGGSLSSLRRQLVRVVDTGVIPANGFGRALTTAGIGTASAVSPVFVPNVASALGISPTAFTQPIVLSPAFLPNTSQAIAALGGRLFAPTISSGTFLGSGVGTGVSSGLGAGTFFVNGLPMTAAATSLMATLPGTANIGGLTSFNSPLGELTTTGVIPTPGLTGTTGVTNIISSPTPLVFSPLAFGPLVFSPTVFPTSPINPSPVSFTGTLPFTGSPINPSPVSFTGTLPFTGSPINPSPISPTGTLPFTGSPINPSPVSFTGNLF